MGPLYILGGEFKIWSQDVAKILDLLKKEGYIESRDGWRTIVLLHERVERNEPLFVLKPRAAPAMPVRKVPLQVVTDGGMKPAQAKPESPKHVVLNTAIVWIERQLPQLREMLGAAHERLAKLDATLAILKTARDGHQTTAAAVEEALNAAEGATAEFFALLRQSGGSS